MYMNWKLKLDKDWKDSLDEAFKKKQKDLKVEWF